MRCTLMLLSVALFPCLGLSATITVPDDHPTIQDAITAAVDGDTIIVRAGTYVENIDFLGKLIRMRSESGPENTVIDGGNPVDPDLGSVVIFQGSETRRTIIYGFTITNGTGTLDSTNVNHDGGGISCWNGSSPRIMGNIITNNVVDGSGGGISCQEGSSPFISDNIITLNTAGSSDHGGGILCEDGSPTIADNIITQNTTSSGAGIFCEYDLPQILNNVIKDNYATSYGGGVYLLGTTSLVENNIISDNVADWGGGGAWSTVSDATAYRSNIISGNSVTNTGSWGGGGIGSYISWPAMSNNQITGNSAGYGGGVSLGSNPVVSIITNNTVVGNSADQGGGFYIYESPAAITNTIIWDNSAPNGPQIYYYYNTPTVEYCDVMGGWSGSGNIDGDPDFIDRWNGDFHLKFGSICKDAGNNSGLSLPDEDFEGDPRIADGTVDMGCDEFHLHVYFKGDFTPGGSCDVMVIGAPGTTPVRLGMSRRIQDPPQFTPWGDLWLELPLLRAFPLPDVNADGYSTLTGTIPAGWPPGREIPFQALAGTELTNLVYLTVE